MSQISHASPARTPRRRLAEDRNWRDFESQLRRARPRARTGEVARDANARARASRASRVAMLARDGARDGARATRDAREDLVFGGAATMRFTSAPRARGASEAMRASPTQARVAAQAREGGEGRTRSPSPAKRSPKGKPRSTRTGAVSARTRLAFSPEAAVAMLRGMSRRVGTGGNGGGGEANARGKERGKTTETGTTKKPTPRKLVRSESFKYLNEAGELEAMEGAANGRDGGKKRGGGADRAGADGNGYKTAASGAKRGRGEQPLPSTSGGGAGSKTKKQALRAKSETKRVSLDPRGRAKNKPFENNTLYQPGNVVVGLHFNTRGGKEWYTNKQLVRSCKPGSLLDISSKSLTAPTKAAISSALRDEANGEKVEKFVRVKVMSHYLDVSGWTLTTVQVVPLRWNRHGPKHILPLCAAAGVELVFNLTEEAAYGCLRVFRFPVGSNGHLSELRKSTKGATSPSTLDSGGAVRPSTPPRMRTPSPKNRKNRAHGGSSDRTSDPSNADDAAEALEAQEEDEEEEDSEEEEHDDSDEDEDEDEDEELDEELIPENGMHSALPSSLPVIKPASGTPFWDHPRNATNAEFGSNAPVLTIGEIGGIEQRHIETPPRKRTVARSTLFDNGRGQLREFYDRFHERATMAAARPHGQHVVTTDTYVPSGSPLTMSLPQSQVHNMPPVAAQRFVSPTVYYLPVPISPHGASGTITETIVGGMRLRITQEPIEGWARHDVVAETANNPHPQLRTESDAFSDVHRERQRVNAKRGVPKSRAKQMRVQDDDDNLLAANLLMLKTSVAGQKRKPPTPSKPRAKRPKSQKVDSARKSR